MIWLSALARMKRATTYAVTVSVVGVTFGLMAIARHGVTFGRLGKIASGTRLCRLNFTRLPHSMRSASMLLAPMVTMGFITRPFYKGEKFMINDILAQAHLAKGLSSAGDLKGRVKDSDPQCEIHNQIDFLQTTLNELHNRMATLSERLVPIRALSDEESGVPITAPAKTQIGSRIQEQSYAVMNITRMVNDILNEIQI